MDPILKPNSPDLPAYQFVAGGKTMAEIRSRHLGVKMQLIVLVVMAVIFGRCFYLSAKLMREHRSTVCFLCILQSFCGLIFVVSSTLYQIVPNGPTCREILLVSSVAHEISTASIFAILLSKAYVARNRPRWFLVAGLTLLVVFHPADFYMLAVRSTPVVDETGTCTYIWADWYPYMKSSISLTANLVFSWAFLSVVFHQWRQFQSNVWESLARDGLQYYLGVTFSNVVCMILTAMRMGGGMSIMIFVADWGIASMLMVKHITSIQKPSARRSTLARRSCQSLRHSVPAHTSKLPRYSKLSIPQADSELEVESKEYLWYTQMTDRALHWIMGGGKSDNNLIPVSQPPPLPSPPPLGSTKYKRVPGGTLGRHYSLMGSGSCDQNQQQPRPQPRPQSQPQPRLQPRLQSQSQQQRREEEGGEEEEPMTEIQLDTCYPSSPDQAHLSMSERYPWKRQGTETTPKVRTSMSYGIITTDSHTLDATKNPLNRKRSVQFSLPETQNRPRGLFNNFAAANAQHRVDETGTWRAGSRLRQSAPEQPARVFNHIDIPERPASVASLADSTDSDGSAGSIETFTNSNATQHQEDS